MPDIAAPSVSIDGRAGGPPVLGGWGWTRTAKHGTIRATGRGRSPAPEGSNRHLRRLLDAIGACASGCDWVGERDLRRAWTECPRGDWMLLAAERVGVDRRLTVRAAAHCIAPLVASHAPPDDPRPRRALDAALTWTDDPTDENVQRAYETAEAAGEAADAAPEGVDGCVAHAAAQLIWDPEAAVTDAAYACTYLGGGGRANPRAAAAAQAKYAHIVRATIPFDAVSKAVAEAVAELDRDGPGPGSLGDLPAGPAGSMTRGGPGAGGE